MTPEGQWSANLFATLKDGGAWAVPRSGLIFRKVGAGMVLIAQMPHDKDMPISAAELRKYQDSDFDLIRDKFAESGIVVTRENENA